MYVLACLHACLLVCLCLYVYECETSISIQRNLLKKFHYDCGQISLSISKWMKYSTKTFWLCRCRRWALICLYNVKLAINLASKLFFECRIDHSWSFTKKKEGRKKGENYDAAELPHHYETHPQLQDNIQTHQFCILKAHIIWEHHILLAFKSICIEHWSNHSIFCFGANPGIRYAPCDIIKYKAYPWLAQCLMRQMKIDWK